MQRPILVLQMQRMGDLILSFPLFLWLQREFPGHPLRVVAERTFYEGLLPVSPAVTYIPWGCTAPVLSETYRLVLNLSHRPEAADLAGRVEAEERLGPVRDAAGHTYIHGAWQLYRASLVGSNRHNRYHWADLNGLDCIRLSRIAETSWDPPRALPPDARGIGLFLGASEEAKRPDAAFWAALVRELLGRDLRPILLGGPAEAAMAEEVTRLAKAPVLSLAGRLTLPELEAAGQALTLLITPDTGPMHLASWSGTRVLNLSMGPVNPWETGPYQPGHLVLRPAVSCTGCWACGRSDRPMACRQPFTPGRVASLAQRIARKGTADLGRIRLPGLDLSLVGRSERGLYHLRPLGPARPSPSRALQGEFWEAFFGHALGLWEEAPAHAAWNRLTACNPRLAEAFSRRLASLGKDLKASAARGAVLADGFWRAIPPLARPFSSYLHLKLQNSDYSRQGVREAVSLWERLVLIASLRS